MSTTSGTILLGTVWRHFRTGHEVLIQREMLVSVLAKPITNKKPARAILKEDLRQFYKQIV